MSLRHIENVARLTCARLVPGPRFVAVEVDYTTAGGVAKTLRLSHAEAEQIRALICAELEIMPEPARKQSFFRSLRRNR
jgi:hypothetical protein